MRSGYRLDVKLGVLGLLLIAWWGAGLLVYVNYFSETERAGGNALKASAWLALPLGVMLLLAATLRARRHS